MKAGWKKFQELIKEQMRQVYSETFIEHSMGPENERICKMRIAMFSDWAHAATAWKCG